MARSRYVYTIADPGLPPEGFTVKHELVLWLRGHPDPGGRVVWRGRDGLVKGTPTELILADLLAGDVFT